MEFGLLAAAVIAFASLRLTLGFQPGGADRDEPPGIGAARSWKVRLAAAGGGQRAARLWDAALLSAVVGLAIGRLAAMISAGTNPLGHAVDILIIRGGVDTVSATVAALVVFGLLSRRDLLASADAVAPGALAGLAGWHGGCFTRGACLGTPSDLPWAVGGPAGVARHPVEIYAAILLIAACVILIVVRRRPPNGATAALAFTTAAAIRLGTEPMRLTIGGGLTWWYLAGAGFGLAAVVMAWLRARRVRA